MSNLDTLRKTLNENRKKILKQQQELRKAAQAVFVVAVKDFFEAVPEVKTVFWTQYTPYFNDGDPCVFRVTDIEFSTATFENGDDIDSFKEENSYWYGEGSRVEHGGTAINTSSYNRELNPTEAACKEFSELIRSIEDNMEEIFGDHCQIILTSDGRTIVEEYEHY